MKSIPQPIQYPLPFDGRVCIHCSELKPPIAFRSKNVCKVCANAQMCARRAANPEPFRARHKRWLAKPGNQEKQTAAIQNWSARNRRRRAETKRAWYAANPDYFRQWVAQHRDTLPAYKSAHQRAYRRKYPDYCKLAQHRRRARILTNGGIIKHAEWQALKALYAYTCLCCGRSEPEIKLTLDHVIPIVSGGTNTIDNAQPLCLSCNSSKGAKQVDYRPR